MAAMQIEKSGNNPKGKKPRAVAVEMLSKLYDQLPEKDLSKDQFINESLEGLGTNKNKPKRNLILPKPGNVAGSNYNITYRREA